MSYTDVFADLPALSTTAATAETPALRPLQQRMRTEISAAYVARDARRLSAALRALRDDATAGNHLYSALAEDGAQAALRDDWAAVAASCRGCHEQFLRSAQRAAGGAP